MGKDFVKIGVRTVERPKPVVIPAGQSYRPPKKQLFKVIATCQINGKQLSRTASKEIESDARDEAYSKLATLIAKQGVVPAKGFGFDDQSESQSPR